MSKIFESLQRAQGNEPHPESVQTSLKYELPSMELLAPVRPRPNFNEEELKEIATSITQQLAEFGVLGIVTQITPGPTVTTFEFKPEAGVKYSRIINLAGDLSSALKVESILIERIPGKSTIGIEVPRPIAEREVVSLREILESRDFQNSQSTSMPFALGKDMDGRIRMAELGSLGGLLVAGSAQNGKRALMDSVIVSMLLKASPDKLKMVLVDTGVSDFFKYENLPHLLEPLIPNSEKAKEALENMVKEMERRLQIIAEAGTRNILQYNRENPTKQLPEILIAINDLKNLMLRDASEIEASLVRIAEIGRPMGIHLLVGTEEINPEVITGLIKANFPARVCFQTANKIESRQVLDVNGAECLLGNGDMLYLPPGSGRLLRCQGANVSDDEVKKVVEFCKKQPDVIKNANKETKPRLERDPMYKEALKAVEKAGTTENVRSNVETFDAKYIQLALLKELEGHVKVNLLEVGSGRSRESINISADIDAPVVGRVTITAVIMARGGKIVVENVTSDAGWMMSGIVDSTMQAYLGKISEILQIYIESRDEAGRKVASMAIKNGGLEVTFIEKASTSATTPSVIAPDITPHPRPPAYPSYPPSPKPKSEETNISEPPAGMFYTTPEPTSHPIFPSPTLEETPRTQEEGDKDSDTLPGSFPLGPGGSGEIHGKYVRIDLSGEKRRKAKKKTAKVFSWDKLNMDEVQASIGTKKKESDDYEKKREAALKSGKDLPQEPRRYFSARDCQETVKKLNSEISIRPEGGWLKSLGSGNFGTDFSNMVFLFGNSNYTEQRKRIRALEKIAKEKIPEEQEEYEQENPITWGILENLDPRNFKALFGSKKMKDLSFHDIEERTGSDRENVKFNYFEATAENGNAVMCSSNGYYLGKKSKESYDLYAPNHARVNAQPLDLFEGEKRLMEEATRDHEEVMALPKVEPPKHQYVLMKTTKPNELATVRRVLGRKK